MYTDIKFLIIVPTLNSANILKRLVESIKIQTHQNWRIVFVDGNSNKHDEDWLINCVESDNRFLLKKESKEYQGIYPAMTLGTSFALKDDWIIFLGSDDWLSSRFSLEIIAKKIKNLNSITDSIVIFNTKFLCARTNKILRFNKVPPFKRINRKIFYILVFLGYMPAHQSACFSANILKKIMPYSNRYLLAADCDLFFKALSQKYLQIIYIDELLINIQAGGISSKLIFKRIKEVIMVYLNHFNALSFIPIILRYMQKLVSRLKNIF